MGVATNEKFGRGRQTSNAQETSIRKEATTYLYSIQHEYAPCHRRRRCTCRSREMPLSPRFSPHTWTNSCSQAATFRVRMQVGGRKVNPFSRFETKITCAHAKSIVENATLFFTLSFSHSLSFLLMAVQRIANLTCRPRLLCSLARNPHCSRTLCA